MFNKTCGWGVIVFTFPNLENTEKKALIILWMHFGGNNEARLLWVK